MVLRMYDVSLRERRNRFLYYLLRDELDYALIDYALLDSLKNYKMGGLPYPFVDKRSLKPGANLYDLPENEVGLHHQALLIFFNHIIPYDYKKYIRFKRKNRVTKENLIENRIVDLPFASKFELPMTYFEHDAFEELIKTLLETDFCLLIQSDPRVKALDRYSLTHYRVKIDWPVEDAAEDLAIDLGYIQKSLYEKGEEIAEQLEAKLFEYYGFHHTVGGRRTAAITAAQLLKKLGFPYAVYVGSAQARTLTRIDEKDIIRYSLLKLDEERIREIENRYENFREHFLVEDGVCVFRVIYNINEHSRAGHPKDGALKEFKPNLNWLNVVNESLVPKRRNWEQRPVTYKILYDRKNPFEEERR